MAFIELVAQKLTQSTKEQNFLGVEEVGTSCRLRTTENLNKEQLRNFRPTGPSSCASAWYWFGLPARKEKWRAKG